MKFNYLAVIMASVAALMMSQLQVQEARGEVTDIILHHPGEILAVDLSRGTIQLKDDVNADRGEVVLYHINKNETRVTDSMDKKFLTVEDLHVGQHITIDVVKDKEDEIVKNIVAEPYSDTRVYEKTQTTVTTTTTTTR